MPILEVEDLTKTFGELTAVNQVSTDIHRDEITALIGPNGAGKTTFFNVLSGMEPPTHGRIRFQGTDITGKPPHAIAKMGLTRSFQITNIFPNLTVFENARIAVQRHHLNTFNPLSRLRENQKLTDEIYDMLDTIGLADKAEVKASSLSYGQKRKLEIALALGTEPAMLLMDEPTAGLALDNSDIVTDLIAKLSDDYPILFVEHDMDIVFELADRILVMHNGELIASGSAHEIQQNPRVKQVYLGEE